MGPPGQLVRQRHGRRHRQRPGCTNPRIGVAAKVWRRCMRSLTWPTQQDQNWPNGVYPDGSTLVASAGFATQPHQGARAGTELNPHVPDLRRSEELDEAYRQIGWSDHDHSVSEGGLEPPFSGFHPVTSGTRPIASDQPGRQAERSPVSIRYPPESVPSSSTVSSTGRQPWGG